MAEHSVVVTVSLPVLARGSHGDAVLRLQALLNAVASAGLAEDGAFGPRTEAAVVDFQTDRRLLVDGIVGPQTWTVLLATPRRFPEIIVYQPQPFDLVQDPIRISGIGRAFEGTISVRARDANGDTLAEHYVQGGALALVNFQGTLQLGAVAPTPQGTVEVFERSAEDGSEIHKVVIPVVFGPALDPTFEGFHPHVVSEGETLSAIAGDFYGDPSLFTRIFEANRDVLVDPDVIFPDQVLRIPFGAHTTFPPGG